jgi:hypothetical protein
VGKTRVEHVVGRHALRSIQSADDEQMYRTVTQAGVYLATAGFLEEANSLLDRLWSSGWPHDPNCWLDDRALTVLWHAAGRWPPTAPFVPAPIDQIEVAHREYMAVDCWPDLPVPTQPWPDLHDLDLFRRSLLLAYPPTENGPLPSAHRELEALMGLEKYLDETGGGWDLAVAACLAAELAAHNNHPGRATRYAVRWAEDYPTFWSNYSFPSMACNRHVAPLLLRGILAAPLGLSATSSRRYLTGLLAAVENRRRHGRTLVFGTWSWPHLLGAISKWAIQRAPDLYTEEERAARWIGRQAATAEAVTSTEARLGLQLPDDYRTFVLASNGLSPTSSVEAPLLPVEEIDYLRQVIDAETLADYKEYGDETSDLPAAIERSILISDRAVAEMVLLIPPLGASDQWQTWFVTSWIPGEVRYPSFRHYIEQQLQDLAAGP